MSGNPKSSRWSSTPAERRHRIQAGWTLPRELVERIRELAGERGELPSQLAERLLTDALQRGPR